MKHKIKKDTICITVSGEWEGFCEACSYPIKLYKFTTEDKNGEIVNRFRCSVAHRERYKKELPPVDFNMQLHAEVTAITDTSDAEDKQQGVCVVCKTYIRKNRHGKRAMFVVRNGAKVLPYLFCWDCRTLVNERIQNKYKYRIEQLLNEE